MNYVMKISEIELYIKENIKSERIAVNYLKTCLSLMQPCSLIRLGDGEAKLLSYPDLITKEKLNVQLKIWFGEKTLTDSDILYLKKELLTCIENADILGLPGHGRTFNKSMNEFTNDALHCQNLWSVIIGSIDPEKLSRKTLVSANIHHYMQEKKIIPELVQSYKETGFICNSPKLIKEYDEVFKPSSISLYTIPGETWSRSEKVSDHYPRYYKDIMNRVKRNDYSDQLWWVGAGILGKIYTVKLAEKGAVAIDMGAVLDGWNKVIPKERQGLVKKVEKMSLEYFKNEQ